ncbi:hypothetical protein BGW37DRAFT_287181 [Umbelopsis sp. PMI_123]|nr:hypothetical protein BGW37DRAFT_287181 [Umbelopsis sp. PMI_123]
MRVPKASPLLPIAATVSWERWGRTLTYQRLHENLQHRIPFRRRSIVYLISIIIITACFMSYFVQYVRMTSIRRSRDAWLFSRFPELKPIWKDIAKDEDNFHEAITLRFERRNQYGCEYHQLSYATLKQIVDDRFGSTDSDPPSASFRHLRSPYLITPAFDSSQPVSLKPGQPYCVRLVVPRQLTNLNEIKDYIPIDGSPWDSIMMTLVRQTPSNTTIPVRMNLWPGHATLYDANELNVGRQAQDVPLHQWTSRSGIHIYEAEISLMDEGNYTLETRLEYTQGLWNFEREAIISYQPEMIKPPHGWELKILGREKDHFDLPLCTGSDHPGRWLNINDYEPERRKEIEPSAVDFEGNFWAPYTCRYRPISYQDFTTCLAKKYPLIHWFGDSNSRRAIKKMVTDGEWCSDYSIIQTNTTIQRSCHCEDYGDLSWNRTLFDPWSRAAQITRVPMAPTSNEWGELGKEDKSEVWFYKMDGLTNLNDPGWEESFKEYPNPSELALYVSGLAVDQEWTSRFGEPLDLTRADISPPPKKEEKRSNRLDKRWYLTLAPPKLLVISLGNWDTSWMPYAEFQVAVQRLINYIKQRYIPYKTAVIYRAPQYFCCRVDTSDWKRRLSTQRMEAYDRYARNMLSKHVGAKVWDVYALGESRSWEDKQVSLDCPSNHVPSDVVAVENQLLMNSLCNSDDWFADI